MTTDATPQPTPTPEPSAAATADGGSAAASPLVAPASNGIPIGIIVLLAALAVLLIAGIALAISRRVRNSH